MRALKTTIPFCAVVLASTLLPAQKGSSELPDDAEKLALHNYRLSMSTIEQTAAASDEIQKLRSADSDLAGRMDENASPEPTLDQQIQNLDSRFPQVAAAIHSHGLTARDYILTQRALLFDLYFVKAQMEKEGDVPPDAVLPANASLIRKNYKRILELMQRLSADRE